LAAACNPYQPSDYAAGWGWVRQIARFGDAWVICGAWDRADIERYLRLHGEIPGLRFVFVPPSPWEALLQRRRPLYEIHYLAHYLWHRRAFRLAARLLARHRFHLVHQLTRNGFREPGFLWRLDAPFLWGPVGGTQNYPWRFLRHAGVAGALKEGLRSLINGCQVRFSPRVRQAAARAVRLVAANSQVQQDFARVHGKSSRIICDTGLEEVCSRAPLPKPLTPLRLLWSGKFQAHKGLPLLLEALAGMPEHLPCQLRLLGGGPQERRWRKLAARLGVAPHCRWLGWRPLPETREHYAWAHLLVFTSLRDTSGNVVLEALSHGLPVVCLDHQGAGDIVTPACGLKIPVTTPARVVAGLRQALLTLAHDPQRLAALSRGARERAAAYLWRRQGERMAEVYAEVLGASSGTAGGLEGGEGGTPPAAAAARLAGHGPEEV
jgi:glycosyltransferase involved in cell wall biosynthesis